VSQPARMTPFPRPAPEPVAEQHRAPKPPKVAS